MNEVWIPALEWTGFYEVSDAGRVRSLTRIVILRNGRRRTYAGRILKPGLSFDKDGRRKHALVNLSSPDRSELSARVHTLVLEAFTGPAPDGLVCCHENGDPFDNRRSNLRWDTQKSNRADCVAHGTDNKGVRHGFAKLTDENVREIRERAVTGEKNVRVALAAQFGIGLSTVSKIVARKTWRHI